MDYQSLGAKKVIKTEHRCYKTKLKHDNKDKKEINMQSLETRYGEMDFYIDQNGKIHIHFTEEEIHE